MFLFTRSKVMIVLFCLGSFCFFSCVPRYLQGTQILSNTFNQGLWNWFQDYQGILKSGRWTQLTELISPVFVEVWKSGSRKGQRYGKLQLVGKLLDLEKRKVRFSALKMELIHIEKITEVRAKLFVSALSSHKYPRGKFQKGFDSSVSRFEMILQKEKQQWKIIKGGF